MDKFKSALRSILAFFGVIAILAVIAFFFVKPYYYIYIGKSDLGLCSERLDTLRSAGGFMKDTADFRMTTIRDSARAKEILDYFQLDTLYSSDADTWTKALAIGKFVASNIPHDNQREWPQAVNAIGLWEYTKTVAPAFNCRLHSILTFELLFAAGIEARYVTCMPQDQNDNDCHVVNEIWLPELGKWAMLDTDSGGYYVSNTEGTPLSLREMRERFISGEKMVIYPSFENGSSKKSWYYSYIYPE